MSTFFAPRTASPSVTPVHTVSLFFQGTGCHREDVDPQGKPLHNTITQLYAHTQGTAKRLFDGVGSAPRCKHSAHPTPGTYVYVPERDIKRVTTRLRGLTRWLGGLLGVGVDANVVEAYQYLQYLMTRGQRPTVINLTGFSRGAYTALIVANLIAELWPDIEVNVCLFDTVPGPTRKKDIRTKLIPRNVKRCLMFLQQHEDGTAFEVMDASRLHVESPETTHVTYEVLPGCHGSTMNFDKPPHDVLPRLATQLAYDFLQRCATPFIAPHPPAYAQNAWYRSGVPNRLHALSQDEGTPLHLLQAYWSLQQHAAHYQSRGYSKRARYFVSELTRYVPYPQYFVSRRHAELCKQFLPLTFDYCCQRGQEYQRRFTSNAAFHAAIEQELRHFGATYPDCRAGLLQQLTRLGIQAQGERFRIPAAPGGEPIVLDRQVLDALPLARHAFDGLVYRLQGCLDNYRRHCWYWGDDWLDATYLRQVADTLSRDVSLTPDTRVIRLQQAIHACQRARQQYCGAHDRLALMLDALCHPAQSRLLEALTYLETQCLAAPLSAAVRTQLHRCRDTLLQCQTHATGAREQLLDQALALQPHIQRYPRLLPLYDQLLNCTPPHVAHVHMLRQYVKHITRLQWQCEFARRCLTLLQPLLLIKPHRLTLLDKKHAWLDTTHQHLVHCLQHPAALKTLRDTLYQQIQTAHRLNHTYQTRAWDEAIGVLQHCKHALSIQTTASLPAYTRGGA
ncbi:MAG: hypothetical protein Tsb005_19010 [Gammaproteobacteria bacterium]